MKTATIAILASMIFLSILLAKVTNLLNTDFQKYGKESVDKEFLYNALPMTDNHKHLLWFLQISDIHISIFRDEKRITEFKEFCQYAVNVFKPSVVLASGDLTDAKSVNKIGSSQVEQEWKIYENVLTSLNITNHTQWLDIRGNHDNFNVLSPKSKENYFANYSIQGKVYPKSYHYQLSKDGEIYSFIAVDACIQPGPRRPFNFVGILDSDEVSVINNIIKKIQLSGSKYTIWFGHFPTSCVLSREEGGIRHLIGNDKTALAYLCGHLHNLGGLVPQMYALQQDGFLELELGDWKKKRMFRLLAIDNGLLSFVDVKHGTWPVALITNPKHARFVIPYKENLDTIKYSTHIRVLAFSTTTILFVKVQIDNEEWMTCKHVQGPLYVAPWQPLKYMQHLHKIEVIVEDSLGRTIQLSQPFSLDGTKLSFSFLPRLVLMGNVSEAFKLLYGVFNALSILPLLLCKCLCYLTQEGKIRKPTTRGGILKIIYRKFWILASVDRIFWPLVIYPIYLMFGPWSIGFIVEDRIGAIFAWGIYVDGVFLPGSFTYAYGFLQVLFYQIPLTFILAHATDYRFVSTILRDNTAYIKFSFQCLITKPRLKPSWLFKIGLYLPFILLISLQAVAAIFFGLAYGILAFLLGPLRTGSVLIGLILWYFSMKLPKKLMNNAIIIWNCKPLLSPKATDLNNERDIR
ncbi:hypothetical protein FQA39_LY13578 [Lamprigera yunnana]|nr:hypothetical protein FQA39_LY13578 [Lamprigera yunnana]